MNFCNYFKQKRIALGTVRKFAKNNGYDPAYISRLENGITLPPKEPEKLARLGKALGLEENTAEWMNFTDLAATAKSEIPDDLKNDSRAISMLPAFYRALRKESIDEEEAKKLLDLIKQSGKE